MFTHLGFQTIGVTDFDCAIGFYRDKLGLTVERDDPYGDSRWIFMEIPGARTKLHFEKRETVEKTSTPVVILVTDNVDATCAALAERGVTIDSGPDNAPWNPGTRWAMIHDSEGNLILIESI